LKKDNREGASIPGATLGQRIKVARQAAGLTQEALGKPELTKGFISLLEHDRAKPSVDTFMRLGVRLGRSVAYFLDGPSPLSEKVLVALANRAWSELARHQYESARSAFGEVAELAATCQNGGMQSRAELGLGEVELDQGQLDKARTYLEAALMAGRASGDALVECRALRGLAAVESRQGQFVKAATLCKEALGILPRLTKAEPLLQGEILLDLGMAQGRLGHVDEAAVSYTRARNLFQGAAQIKGIGEALMGLGGLYSASGDWESAAGLYERARHLWD
jgi:tetratricopeptide (TPR) repeat protein